VKDEKHGKGVAEEVNQFLFHGTPHQKLDVDIVTVNIIGKNKKTKISFYDSLQIKKQDCPDR